MSLVRPVNELQENQKTRVDGVPVRFLTLLTNQPLRVEIREWANENEESFSLDIKPVEKSKPREDGAQRHGVWGRSTRQGNA